MIDFQQNAEAVKIMFIAQCKALGIPLTNKAALLDKVLSLWEENPDHEAVREVMFAALADEEYLTSPFADYSSVEANLLYDSIRETIRCLYNEYTEQAHLEDTFSDYTTSKDILYWQSTAWNRKWDKYLDEGCKVAEVFRKTYHLGDEIDSTILRNICCLIAQIRQDMYLEISLPLILYLALTRYTESFLVPTKTQVCLADLFACQQYDTDCSKKKARKNCKRMIKLFRKLCKIYKKDKAVEQKQCKYGFYGTSNLVEYVLAEQMHKTDKFCPPFLDLLTYMDLSCVDSNCEEGEKGADWNMFAMFDILEEDYDKYCEITEEAEYSDIAVIEATQAYVKEHAQVLDSFMESLYQDAKGVKKVVTTVYEELKKTSLDAFLDYESAIKALIYDTLMMELDAKIEARVYKVCMM